jgi:hypothetical protein
LAAYGGFFVTTFGGTTWYQTPSIIPGADVVFVSLGNNFSIVPNGRLGTGSLLNFVTAALGLPANSGISITAKKGITDALNTIVGKSSGAVAVPCFDGPWDGVAAAHG